jgi:HEAT repeat protein
MKHTGLLVLTLAAIWVNGRLDAAEAAPTPADIDKAVAAIADYDLGKPMAPVQEVDRLAHATAAAPDLRLHLERELVKVLQSKASDECKFYICRLLGPMGSDESIAALAKMLADEKTVHIACYGLMPNPSPKAAAALRDALVGAKGKTLLCLVGAIGDRRDAAATEALAKLLADADPLAVDAAASALGKIGTSEAAAALAKARASADEKNRAVLADGYLRCGLGLAAAGKKDEASRILKEMLGANEPPLMRRGALAGLMGLGGPEAATLALSMLGSDDRVMRAMAIAHLRTLQGDGVTQRFAAELPKLQPEAQVMLIEALADRGDVAARPAVVAAAASQDDAVRVAALKALGRVGDASSVPLLVSAAAEGKGDVEKRVSLVSLRNVRGEGVEAAIVECLKSAKPEVGAALIEVLSDRGAATVVPALLKEAQGPDPKVRVAALAALTRLAGADALPAILQLLVKLEGDAGRAEAEAAVVAVSRKVPDEAARADAALAAYASATTPAAKGSLLRALRGIGNAKSFDAVQAAAKDSDAQVQDAAIRSLADWPDARATAAVLGIVRSTENQTHRVVAMRGAVRLLGLASGTPDEATLKAWTDVMAQARRPEEKKLVLGGLSNLNHPAALGMAESCLDDAAVRAEASLAVLQVARALAGTYPDEASAAVKRLAAKAEDSAVKKQADDLLQQIEKSSDFIASWQVTGPYEEAGKDYIALFDIPFPPEKAEAKDVTWRVISAPPDPAKPGLVDLLKLVDTGEQKLVYVRTWIQSPKAQDARLEFGSDDGIKIWLNGEKVYGASAGGKCIAGAHKADVALKEGWNLLFVKITQCSGPWEFCGRVAKRDGTRLEGVRTNCQHEAAK